MKKVAIYAGVLRPGGGPPGYTYNFYRALCNTKTVNQFSVLGNIIHDRAPYLNNNNHFFERVKNFVRVLFPDFYYPSSTAKKLIKSFDGYDVAILHTILHPRLVYEIKRSVDIVIYMPHSPSVISDEYMMDVACKGLIPKYRVYQYLGWCERVCMSLADRLVFPSPGSMSAYRTAYPDIILQNKHYFIPSGVELDINENEVTGASVSRERLPLRIGYVGRFNTHKGFDLFCQVANILSSESIRFLAAGGGQQVPAPVDYVGWVKDIKKFLLTEIDIIIIPNRVAYFDLLPLEAAAAGLPLVFTPVGGNVDQAKLLVDSVLAQSISVDDLASAVRTAVDMKLRYPDWGKRNREIYLTQFTGSAMVKRWDEFISTLD